MRKCDTCGAPIEEGHPYRVCARCLFEDALSAPDNTECLPQESPGEELQEKVLVHNLFRRKDFFQKYDIIERIGAGGQGDVWKVWDFEFCRTLAMKRLAEKAMTSEPALYRFLAEAQIASQLEHPGILPIFDVGRDPDGRPFYTTQLLPGTTLGDIWSKVHDAKEPSWTVERSLSLLVTVCEIVAHAHSRGVIHRDLKPANVLIGPFGDVRVIDWGSAHVLDRALDEFEESFVRFNQPVIQTERGEALWALGSPLSTARSGQPVTILFMPPELLDGQTTRVESQTDVYSVGVMLYGLLAGRFPYSQSDGTLPKPQELGELILSGPPAPVRGLNRSVSQDLGAICAKAMSRRKADRYGTMLELADDIRASLELRPVKARRPGPVLKAKRFAQRHAGYVSLACLIGVIIAVGFAVAGRLQRERDVARQVQAVHDGELAGRSGHWREALSDWDLAQSAGYKDKVYLDLQRAEAWTILSEPDRSGALLTSLSQRPDLGAHKGSVLLRLGEHELFDEATARQGAQHVREALDASLDPSEELVARGLLADSTPEALDFFHQAIKINSFNHSAHRHSLGLEFLLGRHTDLKDSIRFFAAIYPDDPSPGFLEAAEFAMHGQLKEAQSKMNELRNSVGSAEWKEADDGLPSIVAAVKHFDPDEVLEDSHPALTALDFFKTVQGIARLGASASGSHSTQHTPYLPSIEKGLLEGREALTAMMLPSVGNISLSVQRIKASWHHHPEALIPAFAAMYLETRQPTNSARLTNLLTLQAELYQLAADSPSLLAGLDRTSRYLAANTELELLELKPTNAATLRQSCCDNIQRALSSSETSTREFKAYFGIAMRLGDYDAARELLVKWEQGQPQNMAARHSRIELEIATGNLETAWKLVDGVFADLPNDAKALIERQIIQNKLAKLNQMVQPSIVPAPLSEQP